MTVRRPRKKPMPTTPPEPAYIDHDRAPEDYIKRETQREALVRRFGADADKHWTWPKDTQPNVTRRTP